MIRLGCYEFIVCKGNVFKRIRKTKTHACLCCRAAVSFCNVALHLHLVIRLRANWAAVRHSVQAPPPVIPASEPESWAALCGVLRCTAASLLSIPANASQGPVSEHGVTAQTRRLCHRTPLHCRPLCHSGLRAGILGGFMRGIVLRYRLAIVILALAPQGLVSEHGVTGREENAGTKGYHTKTAGNVSISGGIRAFGLRQLEQHLAACACAKHHIHACGLAYGGGGAAVHHAPLHVIEAYGQLLRVVQRAAIYA